MAIMRNRKRQKPKMLKLLGSGPVCIGSTSELHAAVQNRVCTVKFLRPLPGDTEEAQRVQFERELELHQRLTGEGWPKLRGEGSVMIEGQQRRCMLFEKFQGMSLAQLLERTAEPLSEAVTRLTLGAVASCLAELNALGLVYRDLRPEHIFITDAGNSVLYDLGYVAEEGSVPKRVPPASRYRAAEVVAGEPVVAGSDTFSLGQIALECLVREQREGVADSQDGAQDSDWGSLGVEEAVGECYGILKVLEHHGFPSEAMILSPDTTRRDGAECWGITIKWKGKVFTLSPEIPSGGKRQRETFLAQWKSFAADTRSGAIDDERRKRIVEASQAYQRSAEVLPALALKGIVPPVLDSSDLDPDIIAQFKKAVEATGRASRH